MSNLDPQKVEDRLTTLKEDWLVKYRGLIVRDETDEPEEQNPMAMMFGGRDPKLTDAPLGWGEGTSLRGAPRLDGLQTTMPEKFREGEGVIDLIENSEGRRMIAKIDRSNSAGHGAEELAVYQHIYETVGQHPNLGKVHGLAVVQHGIAKMPALIMDEVVGDSGGKAMRRLNEAWKNGTISSVEYWGAVQFMGRRLLEVVGHLQNAGIAHNDIKPDNFVVDSKTGEPILIDLGLHGALGKRSGGGTEGYTAPQVMERGVTTDTTDVYSVGKTLQRGLSGVSMKLQTDVTRSLASLTTGDTGKLNPEDGASLDFFSDYALDDDEARKVIARVISAPESKKKENSREAPVSDEDARKQLEQWKLVDRASDQNDPMGTRARRRLEFFQNADDLLSRAKKQGLSSRFWDELQTRVERCRREMDAAARDHQTPPEPVKWKLDWIRPRINDFTVNALAKPVDVMISDANDVLNAPPHLSSLKVVQSLFERASVLTRTLQAYKNMCTPPKMPKPKVLERLKKRGKLTETMITELGETESAYLLFSAQLEQMEKLTSQLGELGSKLGISLAQSGPALDELLDIDWFDAVNQADDEFHKSNPIVYSTLDEGKKQNVRNFLAAAQKAWLVIGPQEQVLQTWLKKGLDQCLKFGRAELPDKEIGQKRDELQKRVTVVGRALGIKRDWIDRPGGQRAPLPSRGTEQPAPELQRNLQEMRAEIEGASVAPELSLRDRAKKLVELGESLNELEAAAKEDEGAAKLHTDILKVWKRCVDRVDKSRQEAQAGAKKLLSETTPDHIWRTLNGIRVHLENRNFMIWSPPNVKWFRKELEALARIGVRVNRFLSLLGEDLDPKKEREPLEAILTAMEGFDELEKRFELEARSQPVPPPPTGQRSELSEDMDAVMNDLDQAVVAPWPELRTEDDRLKRRLESVQQFARKIAKFETPVRKSKIAEDIEQYELLVRVRTGMEEGLKLRLG